MKTVVDPVRLLEHVHGHLGWLAVAAMIHPAIVLRLRARADLAVGLATAFATGTAAIGVVLYPAYRDRIKQSIFIASPKVGLLFERKEHLAFGAVLLAWAGALAYVAYRRRGAGEPELPRESLRRASQVSFTLSALLAAIAATLGTVVATFKSF